MGPKKDIIDALYLDLNKPKGIMLLTRIQ